MGFQEVNRSHPGPVCASASWCRVTDDGELIHCRRQDAHPTLGKGLACQDKNQDPYWRYFTRERTATDPPRFSHTLGKDHPADPEERHVVYAAFLRELPTGWKPSRSSTAAGFRPTQFAVELETWAEADGKGIDDLLAAGKTPSVLAGDAVARFVADLLTATAHVEPTFADPFEPSGEKPADRPAADLPSTTPAGRPPTPTPGTPAPRVEMDAADNDFARVLRRVVLLLAARDPEIFQKDHRLVEVITPPALENQEHPPRTSPSGSARC